jgi:hypothetical protein
VVVFVFLDQHAKHIHERSERVIFVFADFVRDAIEQFDKLLVIQLVRLAAKLWLPLQVQQRTFYSFHAPVLYF